MNLSEILKNYSKKISTLKVVKRATVRKDEIVITFTKNFHGEVESRYPIRTIRNLTAKFNLPYPFVMTDGRCNSYYEYSSIRIGFSTLTTNKICAITPFQSKINSTAKSIERILKSVSNKQRSEILNILVNQ